MFQVVVGRISCHFLRVEDEGERSDLGEGEEMSDGEGTRSRLSFKVGCQLELQGSERERRKNW